MRLGSPSPTPNLDIAITPLAELTDSDSSSTTTEDDDVSQASLQMSRHPSILANHQGGQFLMIG